MRLTKKRLALLTVLMAAAYFAIFTFLPESITGDRAESGLFFTMKILFLAMTAAITTSMLLILIFKRDFVKWQLASFLRFRHLLRLLVRRDFVARYRKSVLGVLWSLLNPLLTMLVLAFVFSYLFRRSIPYFPVYLISGQLIYGFFNESTRQAMDSVVRSEGIIKKIYVPKYIFPVSRVLSSLVNVAFSFLAFLLVFIVTGAPFRWTMLLLPVPIFYAFAFSLGVSMLLSALNVFFRDLHYLYGVFLLMLMYLSAIFYPVDIMPANFVAILGLNPIYHYIDYFRSLALYGRVPDLWANMVCIGFALAALCSGMYVFMAKQDKYILHL